MSLTKPFGVITGTALLLLSGFAAFSAAPQGANKQAVNPDTLAFFESKVRPVLVENCFACHGEKQQRNGLRLDSRAALIQGGKNGPALVVGDPERSALIKAIHFDGPLKMPPAGKLKAEEIAALTEWVKQGAPWPETKAIPAPPVLPSGKYIIPPEKKNFWAFQPVKNPALPSVKDGTWARSSLDLFILAQLEAKGLKPAPQADKRTLLRRATFDLTGLPPTPEESNAFLQDNSPNAFAKVVDRLLASPRYGERWGRHWLDVARYADSLDARGLGSEGDISEAWRYRDWVIEAFNRDMPYNQFIINQIAGDLLPVAPQPGLRTAGDGPKDELNIPGTIATGLLAIGNWGNGDADKEKILTDIADDQVDIVSRGFMGLTVACARCHDHKFDPISTKDYYGMAGIFFSTHILPKLTPKGAGETPLRIPLLSKADIAKRDQITARIAELDKQAQAERAVQYKIHAGNMLPQTARYMTAAWEYRHRPASQANLSLADFTKQNGLQEYALRQWMDYLGMGEYRLMTLSAENISGVAGVHSFHGQPEPPSLLVNTNNEARSIATFTLPPKAVTVHPGPKNGGVIGWKSPFTGVVQITGKVIDADPACGNGVAWALDHRTAGGALELASGEFPNSGQQEFAQGKDAANLKAVPVKAGESLELLVLPNGEYSCDTTTVDWTIKEQGGNRIWNLAHDIVPNLHENGKGNPHSDSLGNAGVWGFYDMANSRRAAGPGANPLLAKWNTAAAGTPTTADIGQAAQEFQKTFALTDAGSPFWIQNPQDEIALPQESRNQLTKLTTELDTLRKTPLPMVTYANGIQEGGCPESPQAGFHDVRVHIRGNYARLGDMVPRHFPVVLAGETQSPITQGSGRLELARWITSDTHPLTARVMVNRIWQHHFGQGIVRTPSNFGFLGERPTHPALLDYLAAQFVKSGWSVKQMHRMIMLSATYQQSSVSPARSLQVDPDNRLFGHMNRQRLESEAIRDNFLTVTGKLDMTMGGTAYRDFNTPRRTVYLMTVRSDRSGFGSLFDSPDSTNSSDHRTISTVAPQALFLLNNPFLLEQTRALAKRMLSAAPEDSARIQQSYRLLYGRSPSSVEAQIGQAFLTRSRASQEAKTSPDDRDIRAWEEYCQILLCANEFIYVD